MHTLTTDYGYDYYTLEQYLLGLITAILTQIIGLIIVHLNHRLLV